MPLPKPKWLLIFILHLECDEISRRFQSQPNSPAEWALLRWCDRTWMELLALDDEASRPSNINLPKPFNPSAEDTEPVFNALLNEVKKI